MTLNLADYKKPLDATNKKTLLLNNVPTRSRRQHASTFVWNNLGNSPCAAYVQIEETLKKKANVNET